MAGSDPILARLQRLHPKVIDLSLDRVTALLDRLGRPQDRLPPVVHVAGTNGKGSTLAFLASIAKAAGLRSHRYISPHLVRFNERIELYGQPIDDPALEALLVEVEDANAGAPVTFFEITTAAAFLAFSRAPADLLLLETGLGGRLDATNVVSRPALTIITPISMDHEAFLGDTLAAIAAEKAGILKPGVPCVVAAQAPEALAVLRARAEQVGAPLLVQGYDWTAGSHADGLEVRQGADRLVLPRPALSGTHQTTNAAAAVVAACHLGGGLASPNALAAGLGRAAWPARMQRLTRGPLVERLPAGWELHLDGGHNPAAGEALAETLRADPDPRPRHLVVGMLSTKDATGFLAPLAGLFAQTIAIPIPGEPNGRGPEDVAQAAAAAGHATTATAADTAAAVDLAVAATPVPGRILIAGSLYLAGSILHDHG